MTRRYGRARRGRRVCAKIPYGGEAIKAAIEAAGATLMFLPPYSPDLNPIELMFSKLKTLLRKAAERSVDALWNRIGELLDHFTPQECANFLRHAGYNQT
jgi:transposase